MEGTLHPFIVSTILCIHSHCGLPADRLKRLKNTDKKSLIRQVDF